MVFQDKNVVLEAEAGTKLPAGATNRTRAGTRLIGRPMDRGTLSSLSANSGSMDAERSHQRSRHTRVLRPRPVGLTESLVGASVVRMSRACPGPDQLDTISVFCPIQPVGILRVFKNLGRGVF
jgi:hypothetical protein